MKRELIHIDPSGLGNLRCDNPRCGHVLSGQTWGAHLIGYPCPKCDSNMLTRRDYEGVERVRARIRWLNRWFGWLGSKNLATDRRAKRVSIHHHNGEITFKQLPPR